MPFKCKIVKKSFNKFPHRLLSTPMVKKGGTPEYFETSTHSHPKNKYYTPHIQHLQTSEPLYWEANTVNWVKQGVRQRVSKNTKSLKHIRTNIKFRISVAK